MLIFGLTNPAERGTETNTYSILRILTRIFDARVVEGHLGRRDRELRIAIQALQSVRGKKFFRTPIGNFAAAMRVESAGIESRDAIDAALFRADAVPKSVDALTDTSDRADAGDDCAPSTHAATRLSLASTYAFIQRNVLPATL